MMAPYLSIISQIAEKVNKDRYKVAKKRSKNNKK